MYHKLPENKIKQSEIIKNTISTDKTKESNDTKIEMIKNLKINPILKWLYICYK
jgi:hypothetical protein